MVCGLGEHGKSDFDDFETGCAEICVAPFTVVEP
jgi:hypothetical protein